MATTPSFLKLILFRCSNLYVNCHFLCSPLFFIVQILEIMDFCNCWTISKSFGCGIRNERFLSALQYYISVLYLLSDVAVWMRFFHTVRRIVTGIHGAFWLLSSIGSQTMNMTVNETGVDSKFSHEALEEFSQLLQHQICFSRRDNSSKRWGLGTADFHGSISRWWRTKVRGNEVQSSNICLASDEKFIIRSNQSAIKDMVTGTGLILEHPQKTFPCALLIRCA